MKFLNKIFTIMIFLAVAVLQNTQLFAKESFYSKGELDLLEKTLTAIEYDYGYDYQIEAPYIYSYSYSKDNFDKKEKAFAEIINVADYKNVLDLYKKIQRVQAILEYKMNRYKTDGKWKFYTYINTDLSEPVNNYSALLLKYILKKNPSLSNFLEMQKQSITVEVQKNYSDKDEIIDTF